MTPEASSTPATTAVSMPARGSLTTWALALVPLLLLGALLTWIVRSGPAESVRGAAYPPVEKLSFQRVVLGTDGITVDVLNDGPDPSTIAQVVVDDAFWTFTAESSTTLSHLGRTRLKIPYPWVHGETHVVRLVTSTGLTFDHTIAVAVATPTPVVVDVLDVRADRPVCRRDPGGHWPAVVPADGPARAARPGFRARADDRPADVPAGRCRGRIARVVGRRARLVPGRGACRVLGRRRRFWDSRRLATGCATAARSARAAGGAGWVLALLIAVGIGLHNFGEGLAIGAAFALGEAALGSLLIIGFTLHNTTEGLAIVAPLSRDYRDGARPPLVDAAAAGTHRRRADDCRRLAGRLRVLADLVGGLSWPWASARSRRSRSRFSRRSPETVRSSDISGRGRCWPG